MSTALTEARAIAKEAYIFFRSLVDQYHLRMRYPDNAVNKIYYLFDEETSPPAVFGFYKFSLLDMRKEPLVLCTPQIRPNYMFSILCVDQWAHNYAYFGTRTNGNNNPAEYLLSGPRWKGPIPSNITKSAFAEGDFTTLILRLEVEHPDSQVDIQYVKRTLDEIQLQPLSKYQNNRLTLPLPLPRFPPYASSVVKQADVFRYVNFFSQFSEIYPTDKPYFDRFAKIGVYPGAPWPPVNVDLSVYEAIGQGVWEAAAIVDSERDRQVENLIGGWEYICGLMPPLVGSREVMKDRFLARAGGALSTFEWPFNKEDTVYMKTTDDSEGHSLDGTLDYVLKWSVDDLPKFNPIGCWSITIYTRKGGPVEASNSNVISSNSSRLVYDPDGGITVYILAQEPPNGGDIQGNWLVSPDEGEFQVFLRIFWPLPEVVNGRYAPPFPEKVSAVPLKSD